VGLALSRVLRYGMTLVWSRGGVLSTGRWRGCVMCSWTWQESRGVTSQITAGADAGPKAAANRLSSGVPRSTMPRGWAVWRCFLADVLDGCLFLMCVWQNTPFDWWMRFGQASFYYGSFHSVCSAIGWLAELVGVAC
jgi:hypothetical protein